MFTIPVNYIGYDKDSGRALWVFTEDWSFGGYTIKSGFVFDGGSIPAELQWFLSSTGSGFAAYAIHDWLYTTHEVSREVADAALRDLMNVRGIPKI